MNKLVNEAVRDYLLKTSEKERELEGTLASLRAYRERDLQVREAPATYLDAAREFVHRVSIRHPVKAAMLFGSRARGTHRADSDVDVAILLAGPRGRLMDTSLELADIAFDVLLETNIYIAPLPIWEGEWKCPETHSNPRLLDNIRREGLVL